jgi:uncharacterized membrane protein
LGILGGAAQILGGAVGLQTILFGLSAAFFWGACDFSGGLVSRRIGAVRATLAVQALGLFPVLLIAWLTGQLRLSLVDWLWCGAAGMIGSLGFVAFYRALAEGQMSVAAPVTALTSASLPVLVGFWRDGLPTGWRLAGFGLALAAIWFVSQTGTGQPAAGFRWKNLGLPFLAGLGLGAYFILVNLGSQTSVFAPLVAVRAAGALTLLIFAAQQNALQLPSRSIWPLMALNTALDVGGSLFYVLAGQTGRMDLPALLASLYSGVTVLLAWLLLREKISGRQWLGIGMTLVALILITM